MAVATLLYGDRHVNVWQPPRCCMATATCLVIATSPVGQSLVRLFLFGVSVFSVIRFSRHCRQKVWRFKHIRLFLLFGIPIGLSYIPAYRAVFTKDRYLTYFRDFATKGTVWHRKWKWITIAFCVGSIVMTLMGVIGMYIAMNNGVFGLVGA